MRAKSTKNDAKVSPKELLKQYAASNEANKAKVESELQAYKKSLEALAGYKKSKKSKNDGTQEANAKQNAEACYNSRAKVMWYLNVIDTNCRNSSALLEVSSLRKAKRERVNTGKYRAKIMAELAKLEADEKRFVQRIPAEVMTSTSAEKETGNVGKKK